MGALIKRVDISVSNQTRFTNTKATVQKKRKERERNSEASLSAVQCLWSEGLAVMIHWFLTVER